MMIFETATLCKASGWTEKNFRTALERGDFVPRGGKFGGRYVFTVEDVAEAAIMRRLVHLRTPLKIASEKARNFVNNFFGLIPGKSAPLTTERLAKCGEGRFLQIMLKDDGRGDVELDTLMVMDRPDLPPLDANHLARFDFTSNTVFLVSLASIFGIAAAVLSAPADETNAALEIVRKGLAERD